MTRISTTQTFGIIPVPQTIVRDLGFSPIDPVRVGDTQSMVVHHHGTPSHLLAHISTVPTSPYQYLATRQRTENAVVPIHTSAKFRLFNELMITGDFYRDTKGKQPITSKLSQTVDLEKLAKHWTIVTHPRSVENRTLSDRIYYKVLQQLEKHHKSWVCVRAENTTMEVSRGASEKIAKILEDPKRLGTVLDALPLPGLPARIDKGKSIVQNLGIYILLLLNALMLIIS
jgi:hypothetical protein